MPTRCHLLVLGEVLPEAALSALPGFVACEVVGTWPELAATFSAAVADTRILIPASALDGESERRLRRLTGYAHASVAVYISSERFEEFDRAMALRRMRVQFVHPPRVSEKIRAFILDERTQVAAYLEHLVQVSNPVALEFLRTLGNDPATWDAPVEAVAARLNIGRTTLFREVADAGLPPPNTCQFLFRFAAASMVVARGGRMRTAAKAARYSEVSSLRRAVRRKLGYSLNALRQEGLWRETIGRITKEASRNGAAGSPGRG